MPRQHTNPDPKPVGKSQREYGHSSGDRNTRSSEEDWPDYEGGRQRDASPEAPDVRRRKRRESHS